MATAALNSLGDRADTSLYRVALQVLGILVAIFAVILFAPIMVSLLYGEGLAVLFGGLALASVLLAAALLYFNPVRSVRLRDRDGFIVVALLWFTLSLLGSLPLFMGLDIRFVDAVFESASGITTTGATVLTGLDRLPRSLLFLRQELQWFGGIGVIVSAIALLPAIGLGGMQMMKAEAPGPVKGEKLRPRVFHTAQSLLRIYLALTFACAIFFWLAGMDAFDAMAHSLSTVSTGGYSTHDASLGYFDSPAIETVAVIFMLLGAINFTVHFAAWSRSDVFAYVRSEEVRSFLLFAALTIVVVASFLYGTGTYGEVQEVGRVSLFMVVSVITSTGFGIADFSQWPLMLPVLLIFVSFVGGCAGSTAGGIKVTRFLVMAKQAYIEVLTLIHPSLVKPLRLNGRNVPDKVVRAVWAYFAVYVVVFAVLMMTLMGQGLDQVTAFAAIATCLNNLGPGLGEVATNFQSVGAFEKWVLVFAMIAGRLEIFTILVLLTPEFWRR